MFNPCTESLLTILRNILERDKIIIIIFYIRGSYFDRLVLPFLPVILAVNILLVWQAQELLQELVLEHLNSM